MKKDELSGQKTCASCGEAFACGATAEKCWCFEIALKPETLAKLRKDFQNCLCENCLLSHAPNTKKHENS